MDVRETGCESEEHWVEAEIGRLLLAASVDECNSEPVYNQPSSTAAFEEREKGPCLGQLFSTYLSTAGSHQSDVQELLYEGYAALQSATDSLAVKGGNAPHTQQVFRDFGSKSSSKDGNSSHSSIPEQSDNIGRTKGGNVGFHDTQYSVDENGKERLEIDQNVPIFGTHTASDKVEKEEEFTCHPATTMAQETEHTTVNKHQPVLTGASADSREESFYKEVHVGLADRLRTNSQCSNDDSIDLEGHVLNPELAALLDRVKKDQRACVEELTIEQRQREAELMLEIEEAQRMLAEHRKEEIERVRMLEKARKNAAITLQAFWRGYTVKRVYGEQLLNLKKQRLARVFRAAQLLQAVVRGALTRREHGPKLQSLKDLRKERLQQENILKNKCATKIQALWKGYRIRHIHGPEIIALKEKRIQEILAMNEELNRKLNAMATRIQAVWRGFSVRKVYTSVLRRRMEVWHEDRKRKRCQAATVLQAGWRGYSTRKSMKQWMTELRRERKAMEEERHKAACVLQAYWRMHSCRIKFLQQIKSNTLPHNLHGETCNTTTILQKPNMSGRLTVARRLESALELKSQVITTINTSRHAMQSLTEQNVAMKSMESSDRERDRVFLEEENSLKLLQISRQKEECAAQQARIKMREIMIDRECETQGRESHQTGLSRITDPVSAQMWLTLVEERLQSWFLSITPWKEPNTLSERYKAPIPIARCDSAVKSLTSVEILAASPQGTTPDLVEEVVLSNCGFVPDVSSLSHCQQLCSLHLTHTGLSSLCSLSSNLPLMSLNLHANVLERVDLRSVGSTLRFLDLSENKLGSVHGLESCDNLLDLNISGNRITRLGGLSHCHHLQNVSAESNLLVSCGGLGDLPYLQTLSCASNHLPLAPDVHNSRLLTSLNLEQNNLQEPPKLPHHVVLRELRLNDNSLTDISPLCQAWLPLLTTLSLARNCITQIDSLLPFVMLNSLDVSHNSIYDLSMLLDGLNGCMELRAISLQGNAVDKEPHLHYHLISILPSLEEVNMERLSSCHTEEVCKEFNNVSSNVVYKLCKRQLLEQECMKKEHASSITNFKENFRGKKVMNIKLQQRKQFENLLIRHVKEQEKLGQLSVAGLPGDESLVMATECYASSPDVPDTDRLASAALVLQAAWRGHKARTALTALHHSATVIQRIWRGSVARRSFQLERKKLHKAATVIQAVYRGFWVRRKLQEVIKSAKYVSDEEDSMEEDIDLNITDEDLLVEDVVSLSPTTHTTRQLFTLSHSLSSHLEPTQDENECDSRHCLDSAAGALEEGGPACFIQDQWQTGHQVEHSIASSPAVPSRRLSQVSTVDCGVHQSSGDSRVIPTQAWNDVCEGSSQVMQKRTPDKRLAKNELISEWGFKADATANLLMKRARRQKKLQTKAVQRKRMADPVERLAVFQRRSQPDAASKSKESHRTLWYRQKTPQQASPMPAKMYQWHHSHALMHKDMEDVERAADHHFPKVQAREEVLKPNLDSALSSASKCSLPELDQRVLAGYGPTLVAKTHQSSVSLHSNPAHNPNSFQQ